MPTHASNARVFTRDEQTVEILNSVIRSIPKGTHIYLVGGTTRNAVYYKIFHKALPQRDYDLVLVGDMPAFVRNVRTHGFIYGKIRRKNDIVLKKALVPHPKNAADYLVLDIHRSEEKNILKNLEENSAFSINGFAILLKKYLAPDVQKYIVALPTALADLTKKRLRLNHAGYTKHHGNIYSCLRFMSLGFTAPNKKEIQLLLNELPHLEAWRFDRNVQKVFGYVGGEKNARRLARRLGITIDIFDIKTVRANLNK